MKPGIIVDNFAGGGGASTGIEAALGRAVDVAINHDEEAIRMHEANHPGTLHIRNNVWRVDPAEIAAGRHVQLAWFSPDCKHFSKAKGGKPREKSIRDLAWVVVLWAQRVKPDLILLENVEEFRTWGPLDDDGYPIKERAGETFDQWCRALRKAGYKLQFKELRACDYGAPTIRKRFFMVARCDGRPIVWPAPTHAPADPAERAKWITRMRKAGFKVDVAALRPWRTAAEIIDWSIPCPSIFERKKPLAEKTLRRIAHGVMKFVVNAPNPFIVPLTHHGSADRSYGPDAPLPTVTGANRGEMAMVTPFFARTAHGDVEKSGKHRGQPCHGPQDGFPTVTQSQDSALIVPHITKFRAGATGHAIGDPLHTVTANSFVKRPGGSAPLGLVSAFMAKYASGELGHAVCERASSEDEAKVRALVAAHIEQANGGPNNANLAGRRADAPISTIATKGSQQRVVTSNLIKLRGTSAAHIEASAEPVDEPLSTISAQGNHMAEVRTFLIKYYGNEQDGHGLANPLGTVTVQDRFGLVTVTIDGEEYVIVDIGMRMFTPRELFNAQGFPPDYIIDRDAQGRPMTKTAQVAKCGNSVCPPLAEALAGANTADDLADAEQVAA